MLIYAIVISNWDEFDAIPMDSSHWNCFRIWLWSIDWAINVSDSFSTCASRILQFNGLGPLTLNRFDRPVPFNQFSKTTFWCRVDKKASQIGRLPKNLAIYDETKWWWLDKKSIWITGSAEFLCLRVQVHYMCSGDMDRNEFRTMLSQIWSRDGYEWWISLLTNDRVPCRNWNWLRLNSYSNAFNMYDFQLSVQRPHSPSIYNAIHHFFFFIDLKFVIRRRGGDVGKVSWAVCQFGLQQIKFWETFALFIFRLIW